MELSQIWPLKYLWGRRGVWGRAGCAPLLPHHPPHSPRTGSQVPWGWWLTGCTHRLTGVLPGKSLAAPNGVGYGSLLPMRLADADTRRAPARTTSHGEVSLEPQQLAAGGRRPPGGDRWGDDPGRYAGSQGRGRPPLTGAVRQVGRRRPPGGVGGREPVTVSGPDPFWRGEGALGPVKSVQWAGVYLSGPTWSRGTCTFYPHPASPRPKAVDDPLPPSSCCQSSAAPRAAHRCGDRGDDSAPACRRVGGARHRHGR